MEQFEIKKRPAYFVYSSYHPEGEEAQANWNHYGHPIPNFSTWLFDQLEYYSAKENRNDEFKDEILNTIRTARQYDETCKNLSPTSTIITHMYVCELLVKALLLFFGKEPDAIHGYSKREADKIADYYCTVQSSGIAQNLHTLFYSNEFERGDLPPLREYLKLLPELRKECVEIFNEPPYVFRCNETYGATGAHTGDRDYHYHLCGPDIDTSTLSGHRDLHSRKDLIFPELSQHYTVASYTSFSAEDRELSDDFISVTSDTHGQKYAMGFGQTNVPKQRDIELRFYVVFLLGSIARYSIKDWKKVESENPGLFLMIRRFIENNHTAFPFLILRYMTGRAYSFGKTSVYG
jgi:hypothetical protein